MTRRVGNVIIIEPTPPDKCEGCGKIAELRPYGRNYANICFDCGTADKEEVDKNFARLMLGVDE